MGVCVCIFLRQVAIKIVGKTSNDENWHGHWIPREAFMMSRVLGVEGCIQLIDWYERPCCFYIVMERPADSMDLFDLISKNGPLEEDVCRSFFRQVLDVTMRCHREGILHRDIKDENILVNLKTGNLKLIDFGSAAFLHEKVYTGYYGTRAYGPPEWIELNQYHGIPATVWTLGIFLFNLACGDVPFDNDKEICRAKPVFTRTLSSSLQDLIQSLLRLEPKRRPSLEEILKHPWMAKE